KAVLLDWRLWAKSGLRLRNLQFSGFAFARAKSTPAPMAMEDEDADIGVGGDLRRTSQAGHSLLQQSGDDFTNVAPPNPPDKGYGWFVVLGSFLCNALVDGCCFSYGVMQPHIASSFADASPSMLSLGGSVLTGTYLFTGPLSSALANMFGCRAVVMTGALLTMLAFFAASFVSSIHAFIGVFGFLGGIGFGLIYLPAVVTVGFWFEKRRAFATGIAVCGSGIGTAVFALLTDGLIDVYSWRGTVMILAGLVFNCAVAGSFFMPLERYYLILTLRERRRRAKGEPMVRGHIIERLIENKRRERNISQGSLNGWIITTNNKVLGE
uniref:MFS domain-containing protein n=1 Tax=Macrostomum lignano TaxID=282301 RepID=A0A1I8GZ64_9PLAT